MILELVGGQFKNKGDELMLHAVLQHFRSVPGAVTFASAATAPGLCAQRIPLGIRPKLNAPPRWHVRGTIAYRAMMRQYRAALDLVSDGEIDAVLDFTGFCHGDQWALANTVDHAAQMKRWKKQGKKMILLPQALGPFRDAARRKAFADIVASADLIFARDVYSYRFVAETSDRLAHVRTCPDFTVLVEGATPPHFAQEARIGGIVPNAKMISHTPPAVGQAYLTFLARCARQLLARGIEPVIILHEIEADRRLVALLQRLIEETAGHSARLIYEADPVLLKGILGSVFVLIGSRYHALVGALSQGVPCLGTSWSHKYRALFEDYGCPENLLDTHADDAAIGAKLAALTEEPRRAALIDALNRRAAEHRNKVVTMWAEVDALLGL